MENGDLRDLGEKWGELQMVCVIFGRKKDETGCNMLYSSVLRVEKG